MSIKASIHTSSRNNLDRKVLNEKKKHLIENLDQWMVYLQVFNTQNNSRARHRETHSFITQSFILILVVTLHGACVHKRMISLKQKLFKLV